MPIQTAPWLDVAILPTSWKLRTLTQMLNTLDPITAAVRRQRIEDVRAQVQVTWEMELQWRSARVSTKDNRRPAARPIDLKVDLCVGSLYESAQRILRLDGPTSPAGQAAQRLITRFYPQGAGAITNLPLDEELAVVQSLDAALHGELAQDVATLGLQPWAQRLRALLPEYEAAIDNPHKRSITFTEVQNARAADHEAICRLIISLLNHALQHPADAAENAAVLAIYTANAERVAALRRARGKHIPDISPATGELTEDDPGLNPIAETT
jgi:hypothetical protein